MARKSLSKKTRFEVFKRDSFTCQYCGRKAPDVILEVDHIHPVSKGGDNDILNLVTSCKDCNSGKSDRTLSDTTVIDKKRYQLEELQERKEQLDMMFEWQEALLDITEQATDRLAEHWEKLAPGWIVNDNGKSELRKLADRFGYGDVIEAMNAAAQSYLEYNQAGHATEESWHKAWSKLGGICFNRRLSAEDPEGAKVNYIRGIMRRRLAYVNESWAKQLMQEAISAGGDTEELEYIAKTARNWTEWRSIVNDYIDSLKRGGTGA